MTSQQLTRIPEIFDQAIDLDPMERETFLLHACAGDQAVYREVKSLLGESFQTEDFLKHSALSLVTRAISQELTPLQSGTRLGRYEILTELGRGGMGDVFQARDDIGLPVAIKVLPDYFAQDPERVSRFESEARKMAQLNHPNIAGIHGREVTGGWRFLVLEYVEGETLEARLAQGALPLREALKVFAQIADALAATHRKDIVHRDLKPSNIMLTPKGQVKLLDFGIAKHFHQLDVEANAVALNSTLSTLSQSLTLPGFTPGTLPYMSPEQRVGGKTDLTTDLWAFGVVFYEALTGQNPFRRGTREETASAIFSFTPDWKKLPPQTPRRIRELLQHCLAKDPAQRLRDASEAQAIIEAELTGGFVWPLWLRRIAHYFSRRTVLGLACVAVFAAAYFGWRYYQSQLLSLAVVSPDPVACQPINAQSLAGQLNRLTRVRATHNPANIGANGLTLQLSPHCSDQHQAVLLKLMNAQGLTIYAHLVETQEQAIAKLQPVLTALATWPPTRPSVLNAQLNLVAPALTDLKAEEQNILNLDNWDNEALIDSAIELVKKLITERGDSATLQAALSRANLFKFKLTQDLDDKKKAYDAYSKALTMDPESADALLAAGNYYTVASDIKAITYYQKLLQRRPNDPEAYRGIGRTHALTGETAKAEENFITSVLLRPTYWGGFSELGAFYLEQQNYLLGTEYLNTAAKLVDNPSVHVNLGAAYFYQDRLDEAFRSYENALKRAPNIHAYNGCGMVRYLQKNYAEAAAYFRQAQKQDPQSPEAWGNLGQALYWSPSQQEDSRQALQKAIQLASEQLRNHIYPAEEKQLLSLMAIWQAMLGQANAAIVSINKVLSPDSSQEDVDLMLHAIVVFYLVRQEQVALGWTKKFLANGGAVNDLNREPFLEPLRTNKNYLSMLTTTQPISPAFGEK